MKIASSSSKRPRALVIGASMSGLFAAALLRKAGWNAEVFERSEVELFGRGAGIATHDELLETLRQCGADLNDLGVTVQERIALDANGAVIESLHYPQIVTSWDRLHQIMRATIPSDVHHLGCKLEAIEQDAESVTAVFADGRRETGDLLIGADGYRSTVRGLLAPEVQPIYAGYVVWRGVAEEADIPPQAHAELFEKFAFFLPPHNKNIGYPIAGRDNDLRPGHRRYNWVWYRAAEQAVLDDMLTDSDGVHYEVSISPTRIRRDLIDQLKADAQGTLPESMCDILKQVDRPFFTPIYDLLAERLVYGRVALIGDAASVARPHIGMGIAKAGSDAEALVQALGQGADVPGGLAAFEAERLPMAARAVQQGRDLGEFMLSHVPPEQGAQDAHWREFHSVGGIMKHTANSAFLRAPQ